ncbi:hypothetical protein ADICYQ_1800 [Cyclobacterium qasimii M12-11B]|uniref:Uncharacterized protein n=2 Tax=Cyclobacterium qasimii TaxID=1350429 RepID=S7VI00_9BACT|nr:hypothetical protein ADICYQ_1800 [Cyclobacterium qasimii M12-11B]
MAYRNYVTNAVLELLEKEERNSQISEIVELGINHEQQHQELLVYDIKYILGNQPTFPKYGDSFGTKAEKTIEEWLEVSEGIKQIGFAGDGFSYDNELGKHRVFLEPYSISKKPCDQC